MPRSAVLAAIPALALALALPALADDTSTAMINAAKAYAAGNLKSASQQLSLALAEIRSKQQALLKPCLPPVPKGYTMSINPQFSRNFPLTGGGTGIEAIYNGPHERFRLDITVDNPMIDTIAPMLVNPQIMAQAGKVVKIGRQLVLESDRSFATLVDHRILVQLQGGNMSAMLPVMKAIDFTALASFDQ